MPVENNHVADGAVDKPDGASAAVDSHAAAEVRDRNDLSSMVVIQFRGDSETQLASDEYRDRLQELGFQHVCRIPVLKFEYTNDERLRDAMTSPSYTGLVLTSPRAVSAVTRAFDQCRDEVQRTWGRRPVYCVGPATERAAVDLGLTSPLTETCGNASELATLLVDMLKSNANHEKLLMPCSSIARDILPETLSANGISVECLIAYETQFDADALNKFDDVVAEHRRKHFILIFFSPSNVRAVASRVRQLSAETSIKFVAVGPTTRDALIGEGFEVYCTSSRPTAAALVESLSIKINQPLG